MASPTAAPGSSPNGSTPQGSSQNTSASRRTRSVGTKLTDEEYAQLESLAAARGVTPGEWVRELVLEAFGKPAAEAIEIGVDSRQTIEAFMQMHKAGFSLDSLRVVAQ